MVNPHEDFEQTARLDVGNVDIKNFLNLFVDICEPHLFQSREIMQTRFIGDEVLSWPEIENFLHEFCRNVEEHVDPRGGGKFDFLALEGTCRNNSIVFVQLHLSLHQSDTELTRWHTTSLR